MHALLLVLAESGNKHFEPRQSLTAVVTTSCVDMDCTLAEHLLFMVLSNLPAYEKLLYRCVKSAYYLKAAQGWPMVMT